MTKKLEELLNLPPSSDKKEKEKKISPEIIDPKTLDPAPAQRLRTIEEFDKISAALPQVKGLGDLSDTEFDSLAQRATDAYDDLMDLGMNVEARYSTRIFEVASSMLKNAIDAKSAKIDKKLKMIELQLKKQAIDQKSVGAGDDSLVEGKGFVVADRNSLLQKLKNIDK
jgi:hypothetical protein